MERRWEDGGGRPDGSMRILIKLDGYSPMNRTYFDDMYPPSNVALSALTRISL